ncbi:pab1-binding protein [Grosmannia clavigera kw1407]|uniref:Pab1-binding protein n=1 Tax=Grosmannia clavigera (strain kw1407 / UAMH 11150) TaxID=655863 RepID=F0X6Q9_GROCL|nr:pab1-binding protein [Grosmannia clavigera kw1407]EFX06516.1 pab1-binding protein [Grosmannia clavigera kw1407]
MSFQRKDGSNSAKGDGKTQNGTRSGFRTDTAISNSRPGNERVLKRWVPEAPGDLDGPLERASSSKGDWDQFAVNERLFGLKTDYDENFYTTAIDKNHPKYNERLASADRKAREIEKSAPTTSHVAEERVMDFGGTDNGGDEEDKYSGVRRQQDFPPLSSGRDNKYTPPARRAPTGHTTVVGAPVDPAIIMAQVKGGPGQSNRKQLTPKPEDQKKLVSGASRPSSAVVTPLVMTPEPKNDAEFPTSDAKQPEAKIGGSGQPEPAQPVQPTNEKSKPTATAGSSSSSLRPAAVPGRAAFSPNAKPAASVTSSAVNSPAPPSAADGVEKALLKDFKNFASQERIATEKARQHKMKADAQVKLQELKKFATNFKLTTPVPSDLISIIAKDPAKQKQIQEKALQNVEEMAAKTKAEAKVKDSTTTSPSATSKASNTPPNSSTGPAPASKPATNTTSGTAPSTAASGAAVEKPAQANNRAHGPVHGGSPSVPGRHPNSRPPYMQQNYRQQSQMYRGDHRSGGQHMSQGPSTGHLAERLRNNMDQTRYPKQPAPHAHYNAMGDMRAPPTGPANSVDPNYSRRISAVPTGAQKLNPTTHEFRPSPFAASFNPAGPSTSSSPQSAINNMSESIHPSGAASTAPTIVTASSPQTSPRSPIRRKVKAVDAKKCQILDHIRTIKPPQGRKWDDNDGLRPSYDTPPTWRQPQDDEKADSTMRLTYKEYFERVAFTAASMVTPIVGHALPHGMPQMVPHQMPYHLQQHGGHMAPRPSHMPPMPMHAGGGPHGPAPHMPYNGNDDHRMMHSNSAQSYASPRMTQVPMYAQQVGGTPQMAYNQPVMPFIQGTPQMNNFRNYPNNPQQYMQPQSGPMMSMMQPQQFVAVPGGILPPGQQMPGYPGPHPSYMPPPGAAGAAGGVPPPQGLGANGYPSPRPVPAPMMAQQGSQQGQAPMYGMSPSMQYQQPAFGPQHPGQGGPMRGGYNNPGSQQFGTSPQQMHQYGPPHRNGSGSYGGKNFQNHGHNSHQGPPPHHLPPPSSGHQSRAGGEGEETK